jgi:hypothetical protein
MPKPFTEWKVLPHGKLTAIDPDILTVVGDIPMPVGDMKRRMTVVRLQDGRLVIFSAVALDEDEMKTLEAFGTPAFLVVPNSHHRLDSRIWKDRYPAMQVVAPEGARAEIEKIVPVDTTRGAFNDPNVELVTVNGTRQREFALQIKRPDGTTLVLNDIVGNIRDSRGFGGWVLRRMGFAGDQPHVPLPIRVALVDDKAALAAQLRAWADLPGLRRVIVSHGSEINNAPQRVLREVAASLE